MAKKKTVITTNDDLTSLTEHLPAGAVEIEAPQPAPAKTLYEMSGRERFLSRLQKDNVFIDSKIVPLQELTGMPALKGCAQAIVAEGKIVHVASDKYGYVPNEKFFYDVESQLIEHDINYATRSINRENKQFAVDYILTDENYHVNVKNDKDLVIPMLRFSNNYDGSGPTTGSFGFFREVCSNGLHIAQTRISFKVRHHKAFTDLILPNIKELIQRFMDNEFFSLHKKFQVLCENPIKDLGEFVKFTCTELDLFKYEASEKNPNEPSANAKLVMDTITREAKALDIQPNLWLGYNAFNEFIHSSKKTFTKQRAMDNEVFDAVMAMAN